MATYMLTRWHRILSLEHHIWESEKQWAIQTNDEGLAERAAHEVLGDMNPKERYATLADDNGKIIWETPRHA